jgi:hypothetical protein
MAEEKPLALALLFQLVFVQHHSHHTAGAYTRPLFQLMVKTVCGMD